MTALVWDARLPRDEKFILLAYADHADPYGESIYPSKTTIEHMTGYSLRSVKQITATLVQECLLIQQGESRLGTMGYSMNVPKLRSLCPGGAVSAPVQNSHRGGCKKQHGGGAEFAPNPPVNTPSKPPGAAVPQADLFEAKVEHPELTGTLRTPELLKAWAEWKQHRKEKRASLTASAIKKQVADLLKWGPGLSVAAIDHSIRQGYVGLFPPGSRQAGGNPVQKRTEPITSANVLHVPPKA